MGLPHEHETVEPQPDPVRAKVDEWLAGIQATREGRAETFFIHHTGTAHEVVTQENADEVEARIRDSFGELYPELVVIESDAVEIRGELTAGPAYPEQPGL